jgi:hypothetical protein
MKRSLFACTAAVLVAGLIPTTVAAAVMNVGTTASPLVAPVCPPGVSQAKCTIVLTQVTALETVRDGRAYPTTISKSGQIVAVTLGVSALSTNRKTVKSDIHFLDATYGGTAQAQLTVLKRVGPKLKRRWVVAAQSADFHLQPYLGQVVQFPLSQPLPVVPGEVLALTVPTWAPVLSFDLTPSKFAYRQSRRSTCNSPASSSQAQITIGQSAQYGCDYTGTRVEYSATEVTSPSQTKNYVK